MNHNNNFNFLRIFAAILVGITHSYAITGNQLSEPLYQLTHGYFYLSSIGLYIFFFISGYLVSHSAMVSKSPLLYLEKRALRIYPALIVVVLLSVFVAGPLLTTLGYTKFFTNADTWKYLWTATGLRIRFRLPGVFEDARFAMTGFNGSLWSIKLELEMYALLLMLMIIGIIKKRKLLLIIFTILMICGILLVQFSILIPDDKSLALACTFLFGCILQTQLIPKKFYVYLLIVSGSFLLARISGVLKINMVLDEVIFFGLLTYFIAYTKWFSIPVKNDISYGVYIYTFPLQQFFFQLSFFKQSPLMNLLFSLCCSMALAFFSWTFVEKPAIKYKKNLS